MEKNITITGVTKAQVKLLDTMWGIDSSEGYMQWKASLSPRKQREVALLEEMVLLADIDTMAEEDLSDAVEVLSRFRSE